MVEEVDNEPKFELAKRLLAAKEYIEAGKLFGEIWRETRSSFAGTKYIHCLRKAGYADAAVTIGERALAHYPDDQWIRNELIWAHYDAHIKVAKQNEELGAILHHAGTLLTLNPEALPFRLTVQAVIHVAKRKQKWQLVSDWCSRLNPQELEVQASGSTNGRAYMADRQKWYFAKIPALIALERWDEARKIAQEATDDYPREIHFRRWAALALAGQGQIESAITELETLNRTARETWYVSKDLCSLYIRLEKYEEALRYGCQSALGEKEHKLKTTLYDMLAGIGLAIEAPDFAAIHLVLAKATRQAESWNLSQDFLQLDARVQEAVLAAGGSWPQENNIKALARQCEREWKSRVFSGLQRQKGMIESLPEGKKHGWIRAQDGTRVYFQQRDVPRSLLHEGARLSFVLVSSWDQKREQESSRAADFRPE